MTFELHNEHTPGDYRYQGDRRRRRRQQRHQPNDRVGSQERALRCREHRPAGPRPVSRRDQGADWQQADRRSRRRRHTRDGREGGARRSGRAGERAQGRGHGVHHRRARRRHRHRSGPGDRAHRARARHSHRRRGNQAIRFRGPPQDVPGGRGHRQPAQGSGYADRDSEPASAEDRRAAHAIAGSIHARR